MENRLRKLLMQVASKDAVMARAALLFMGVPNSIEKSQDACHIVMRWTCREKSGRPFASVRTIEIGKIVGAGLEAEMNDILSAFTRDGCA